MYALVCIEVINSNISDQYTYKIPEPLIGFVGLGTRVLVDFGARRVLGYVIEVTDKKEYEGEVKEIVDCLDYSFELSEEQIKLCKYISYKTNINLMSCLNMMFPSFLKTKYLKFISINNNLVDPNILMLFGGRRKIILTKEILKEYPKIKSEIEKGNLSVTNDIYIYGKRKYKKIYYLNYNAESAYQQFTGTKLRIVKYLEKSGKASIEDIVNRIGCSMALLFSLEKDEILVSANQMFDLNSKEDKKIEYVTNLKNLDFSFDKKEVKEKFNSLDHKPYLLYSNDEKFKKELYLDICIDMIKISKLVLIITPTIILNYSIYNFLFKSLPGSNIVNFSNDLNDSIFYENYLTIKNDHLDVVVTTSVGAFFDYQNIGVIIVVDAGNQLYIKEKTPKINIVDCLIERSKIHNAKIILESNPPTIENFHHYYKAEYNFLKYIIPNNKKFHLVNTRDEIIYNKDIISRKLESEIEACLEQEKQVMLILNTKGYSNHLSCQNCGDICKCARCGIPLVYYKEKDEVKCNYCGSKLDSLGCKKCSHMYSEQGYGIEKVNEEVLKLFRNAKTLLIDSSVIKTYDDYRQVVVLIESKEVDIIIGTNYITTFLEHSEVNLVGFISFDNLINVSDYRASSNAFHILNTTLNSGSVVVQGYDIENDIIKYAIENNFLGFYNQEIKTREMFSYPPFSELNKIIIVGEYKEMYHCANYIKKIYNIITNSTSNCLGPTYNKIYKGVVVLIKQNDYEKFLKFFNEVKNKFKNLNLIYERYPKWLN